MGTGRAQRLAVGRRRQAPIPRQVDIDLVAAGAQRTRQRVDHVGQAAGLGEWFTFRGEHRDTHRARWYADVPAATCEPVHERPSRVACRDRGALPQHPHAARQRRCACRPSWRAWNVIAYDLYWSWHPQTRALFSRIDRDAWRRFRSPVAVLQAPPRLVRPCSTTPDFMVQYRTLLAAYDAYLANGTDNWFDRNHAGDAGRPGRLLLRRVRAARVAGHLLRRPGRAGGRPLQGRLGHGPAVRGRGPVLPARLLPAVHRCRRPPGARLPRPRRLAACRCSGSRTRSATR